MFYAILKDISFIGATKSMVQIRKQSQVYFVLFLSLLCKGILPFKVFRLHEQNYRSIICQIYKKKKLVLLRIYPNKYSPMRFVSDLV